MGGLGDVGRDRRHDSDGDVDLEVNDVDDYAHLRDRSRQEFYTLFAWTYEDFDKAYDWLLNDPRFIYPRSAYQDRRYWKLRDLINTAQEAARVIWPSSPNWRLLDAKDLVRGMQAQGFFGKDRPRKPLRCVWCNRLKRITHNRQRDYTKLDRCFYLCPSCERVRVAAAEREKERKRLWEAKQLLSTVKRLVRNPDQLALLQSQSRASRRRMTSRTT